MCIIPSLARSLAFFWKSLVLLVTKIFWPSWMCEYAEITSHQVFRHFDNSSDWIASSVICLQRASGCPDSSGLTSCAKKKGHSCHLQHRAKRARTGHAALRHAILDLACFGATNLMAGPSPKQTWSNDILGGFRTFAAIIIRSQEKIGSRHSERTKDKH